MFYLLFHLSKYTGELIKYNMYVSEVNLIDSMSDLMS